MKTTLLVLIGLICITTHGQQNQKWCGTDKILSELKASNPSFSQQMHQGLSNASSGKGIMAKATLTVPVVVHILHDNGIGNISDEQINNALEILNIDYNRLNIDAVNTRNTPTAPFEPNAGSMDVEFKLAKIDPQGNCTNGIVRVNAPSLANNANDDCKYSSNGGSDQWPMDKYVNLWVVNSIESDGAGTTLGYAYLPYWPNGTNYGILIRNDAFGKIETAIGSDGRTLTHEMGHLLGLLHIFDAGFSGNDGCHTDDCNASGDYCCDTPPQTEANWGCSSTWNSCTAIPVNDPYGFDAMDQIENYMSYNACQNMFSIDQVNVMQTNFVDISFMANMITGQNLIETGVDQPDVFCKAEFEATKTGLCVNDSIVISDYSFQNPTTWNWTVSPGTLNVDWEFANGTSPTSQNPVVRFLNSGTYSIELLASDGVTSDNELKANYITVFPSVGAIPFLEGFESYPNFGVTDKWVVYNPGGNNTFIVDQAIGHTGNKSARLSNFGETGANTDELIAASVDLSAVNPTTEIVTLSFRYAYRKKTSTTDEWLKVFITKDCGENWLQRKTLHGSQLTTLVSATSWQPTSQADWVTVHMTNITSDNFVSNFRYKFEFEGNNGNNFFLDDINIYKGSPSNALVGINELISATNISLYPNPAEDEITLEFNIEYTTQIQFDIVDITGNVLQRLPINAINGTNLVSINTESFSAGMYFVKMKSFEGEKTLQFVIK